MNDELLKAKYRNLYYNLSSIKYRFDSIKSTPNEIKSLAGNTLRVNKKTVEKENLDRVYDLGSNVSSSISSALSVIKSQM